MRPDGPADRFAQLDDFRPDPVKQLTIGLRPAANRLGEQLAARNMQLAKRLGQAIERRKLGFKVVNADKALIPSSQSERGSFVSRQALAA